MKILLNSILLFEELRMVYWKKKSIVFANIFLSFQASLSMKAVLSATLSAGTGTSHFSMTVMLWTDTFMLILFRYKIQHRCASLCVSLLDFIGREAMEENH